MSAVPAYQTDTGTILAVPQATADGRTVVYARVSSSDQKEPLPLQVARVVE